MVSSSVWSSEVFGGEVQVNSKHETIVTPLVDRRKTPQHHELVVHTIGQGVVKF
jgi:hypothetical protein